MTPDEQLTRDRAREEERRRAEGVRRWLVYRLGDRAWGEEERRRELHVLSLALEQDPLFLGWFLHEEWPEPVSVLDEGPAPVEEEGPAPGWCAGDECSEPLPSDAHPAKRYCSERCRRRVGMRRFKERQR